MDVADLDYRARTLQGCIPPHLVSRLLELGHDEEVARQAGRGEWFCARERARLLGALDRQAQAWDVLAPYVATGWWTAAETAAGLLEGWGRAEEAMALVRPHGEAGDRSALVFFARLLARHGRADEAFTLVRPYLKDWWAAAALVDVAQSAGRDEKAAALLAARIEAGRRCGTPSCHRHGVEPSNAVALLAAIRERQGRIDDAVALLHTRDVTSVNGRDELADLLARHDRIEDLRAYARTEYHGHAAQRLAEVLEERGDVEGAIAVYQQPGDSPARRCDGAVRLAQLLVRHGRAGEAIAVMRALADSPEGGQDWIVDQLCTLYADQGRARDGLVYLDALKERRGEEDWDFFRMRLPLLVACGLREEAIEQVRAHPEGGTWYAAWSLAGLLADAGRLEEAVAVLVPHLPASSGVLAWHLIDLGRIEEAVDVLQRDPAPVEPPWTGEPDNGPPF
ncbi:tetratricopeptide repeat protein [Streptomyces sp. NPDC052023]|uniref:tetratricopeptide repeat protein n=1 Tax=Streptomyces sp. NPDC052023 TaxID=3365681 RepID=UPI0037D7E53A